MSSRVAELFLFDILVAMLKIEEVANRFENAQNLKHDFMAWDTVIREFEIIGEATSKLIKTGLLDEESSIVVQKIKDIEDDLRNEIVEDVCEENRYLPFVVNGFKILKVVKQ
ncbi:hypothetical protein [Wolinella succinogenes]|uniref:hypothetical protein n=1 Tax=Wolinella succinogenes TaxID=844 RepID=UPI00240915C8|nr:hypothetical protein [Wolinella succinogenes]